MAKYSAGAVAMHHIMLDAARLGVASDPAVEHTLGVRSAMELDDFRSFFGLLKKAPFQSATMMSLLVDRMRHSTMRIVCRAFRPRITLKSLGCFLN